MSIQQERNLLLDGEVASLKIIRSLLIEAQDFSRRTHYEDSSDYVKQYINMRVSLESIFSTLDSLIQHIDHLVLDIQKEKAQPVYTRLNQSPVISKPVRKIDL